MMQPGAIGSAASVEISTCRCLDVVFFLFFFFFCHYFVFVVLFLSMGHSGYPELESVNMTRQLGHDLMIIKVEFRLLFQRV